LGLGGLYISAKIRYIIPAHLTNSGYVFPIPACAATYVGKAANLTWLRKHKDQSS